MNIETIRHSLSHVMAAAILELYPNAKLAIGPAIENGFYYDFDLGSDSFKPEDLHKIEKKMREIINQKLPFEKSESDAKSAIKQMSNQPYKVELIEDLVKAGEKSVSFYKMGSFTDLCKGPHVENTEELKNIGFKLDKIAGAYWRGSEKNKMLQRIYGLAFETKEELAKYEEFLIEAEKRDHRKLGSQMDLFSFHEEGPGFPFWHPKGMIIWDSLMSWWKGEHKKAGYVEIKTPIILSRDLWEQSGHWDNYKDAMYFTKIDDRDFAIKPMNCPGGMLIYKNSLHSYKEFPIRVAEVGLVHRHELAGTLHGLMRVRAFHQDDAHVYCLPNQIESEVNNIIDLIDKMYGRLGLKYHIELSTKPEKKSIGSDEMWTKAEKALQNVLEKKKIDYKLNAGDGAFYGPKIDFHITDAIGRTWQTGTIQLDFAMPERFELEYIDENSKKQRPVMIHRTVLGSFERFIGVMIEHFAGALPVWLAPVQAVIIPISEKHIEYAKKIEKELLEKDIRVEIDDRNESMGKKIRESELQKVPYMLVVGDKEIEVNKISVRKYGEGDKGVIEVKDVVESINA